MTAVCDKQKRSARRSADTRVRTERDDAATVEVHVHKQNSTKKDMIKLPFMIALLSKRIPLCSQTRGRGAMHDRYESLFVAAPFASGMILDLVNRMFTAV